jgi:hypothetical protein
MGFDAAFTKTVLQIYLRMLDARLFLISNCLAFSSATRLCMI